MNATQRAILDMLDSKPRFAADITRALQAEPRAVRHALAALEAQRLVCRGPKPRRKPGETPTIQPRTWKRVPADAREAAEVAADLLAAFFQLPRAIFFKETRGAVEETYARAILYYLLVSERGFTFEVAGEAVGRHRESVQNGCDVIGALREDDDKPEIDRLIERFAADLDWYLTHGGAYRRAADAGVAAVLAAANENASEEGRANSQGLSA